MERGPRNAKRLSRFSFSSRFSSVAASPPPPPPPSPSPPSTRPPSRSVPTSRTHANVDPSWDGPTGAGGSSADGASAPSGGPNFSPGRRSRSNATYRRENRLYLPRAAATCESAVSSATVTVWPRCWARSRTVASSCFISTRASSHLRCSHVSSCSSSASVSGCLTRASECWPSSKAARCLARRSLACATRASRAANAAAAVIRSSSATASNSTERFIAVSLANPIASSSVPSLSKSIGGGGRERSLPAARALRLACDLAL